MYTSLDTDELVPQAGKDKVYDEIMEEIAELEEHFEKELKKFEKKLGYDTLPIPLISSNHF
jgi:DNA mismatch repair protein MSH6